MKIKVTSIKTISDKCCVITVEMRDHFIPKSQILSQDGNIIEVTDWIAKKYYLERFKI